MVGDFGRERWMGKPGKQIDVSEEKVVRRQNRRGGELEIAAFKIRKRRIGKCLV